MFISETVQLQDSFFIWCSSKHGQKLILLYTFWMKKFSLWFHPGSVDGCSSCCIVGNNLIGWRLLRMNKTPGIGANKDKSYDMGQLASGNVELKAEIKDKAGAEWKQEKMLQTCGCQTGQRRSRCEGRRPQRCCVNLGGWAPVDEDQMLTDEQGGPEMTEGSKQQQEVKDESKPSSWK